MPETHSHRRSDDRFQPVAALLACAFPGLGHAYLREYKRSLAIAAGILSLFSSGLLIGGISSIDRKDNFVWFLGQSLVGPLAFGVDYLHQSSLKAFDPPPTQPVKRRPPKPNEVRSSATDARGVTYPIWTPAPPGARPPYTRSLGKVAEIGTLFSTIAGMMNLIVIIDAAFRAPRQTPTLNLAST